VAKSHAAWTRSAGSPAALRASSSIRSMVNTEFSCASPLYLVVCGEVGSVEGGG
jgi:hypothetical protein